MDQTVKSRKRIGLVAHDNKNETSPSYSERRSALTTRVTKLQAPWRPRILPVTGGVGDWPLEVVNVP